MFDFDGVIVDTLGISPSPKRTLTVPESIQQLVKKLVSNFHLAIISSSQTSTIKDIIAREGVADCFSDVLGYDVDSSKVVRIKMMLDQYGAKPNETVFITDTSGDIYDAHESGVPAIAVTWGMQSRDTLADAKPLTIVDSVAILEQEILGFFSGTIGE
ncbi:MAG: HAD hydrolase-like protein [bacterium]